MQNNFEGNKTLFWKWIKKIKKGSSSTELVRIENTDGEMDVVEIVCY